MGSVSEGVVHYSSRPVLVVRAYPVVLPVSETSRVSEAAAPTAAETLGRHAVYLAKKVGAKLFVLGVPGTDRARPAGPLALPREPSGRLPAR